MKKRKLFDEIREGFDALAKHRRGKRKLRTHVAVGKRSAAAKPAKQVPKFRSEEEERAFWAGPGRDSTQYVDWSKARVVRFPKLKLSGK